MIDIVEPNLHPIIVHFVIAFLITGPILLLLAALLPPDSKLRVSACHAGDWMMGLGLLAMIAAIAAGFQAYYSVAHDGPSHIAMTDHRNWAIVTATSFLAIGLYRLYKRGKAPTMGFLVALFLPVMFLTITGWKGGHLVYRYGLGVASLPEVTGAAHDHVHSPGAGHSAPATATPQHDGDHPSARKSEANTPDISNGPHNGRPDAESERHEHHQHDH